MKHNHHIDFFSSPNRQFIGFSDVRHPKEDINYQDVREDEIMQDKKAPRKSSFSFMYEPIMPFDQDFFQEKLQELEQASSYGEDHHNQNFREDTQMKSPYIPQNLLDPRPNYPVMGGNRKKFQEEYSDMFCDSDQNKTFLQGTIKPTFEDQYMTPKKKVEFFNSKRFTQSTAQKSASRSTEKGLRRLSTLAYSIVNSSSPTTYKQVAQKLLSRLNFDCADLDDEQCRAQKSSMQNVKRRVYDSLNVLIALGVINRSGNKITKQKEKKSFLSGQYSDLQKYNELLNQYKKKLLNVQMKRKNQRQLKEKLAIFKKNIERNRKTKLISKNKIIRLPFLVFSTKQQQNQSGLNKNIEWIAKKSTQIIVQKQKKKVALKRNQITQSNQNQNFFDKQNQKLNDMIVKMKLKCFPQSYGDLDFFQMIEEQNFQQNLRFNEENHEDVKQKQIVCEEYEKNQFSQYQHQRLQFQQNQMMLNLIDDVIDYE